MPRPMFELSTEARTLASVLRECAPGDVVSYVRLSESIGRDVRSTAAQALQTARRIVMREHRMVFDAVRGNGLMRLTDDKIVGLADRTRAHIRRSARKTAVAMTCVDYDAMSRESQVKHNASLSLLGAIAELSSEKAAARIESKVAESQAQLPAAKAALEALGSIA